MLSDGTVASRVLMPWKPVYNDISTIHEAMAALVQREVRAVDKVHVDSD